MMGHFKIQTSALANELSQVLASKSHPANRNSQKEKPAELWKKYLTR